MRTRHVYGLVVGIGATLYLVVYAAMQPGVHPAGLAIAAVFGVAVTCASVFVGSWLIDKRWPHLRNRK
jgi:4-hydroxybenzoate polyprenyltransferase